MLYGNGIEMKNENELEFIAKLSFTILTSIKWKNFESSKCVCVCVCVFSVAIYLFSVLSSAQHVCNYLYFLFASTHELLNWGNKKPHRSHMRIWMLLLLLLFSSLPVPMFEWCFFFFFFDTIFMLLIIIWSFFLSFNSKCGRARL